MDSYGKKIATELGMGGAAQGDPPRPPPGWPRRTARRHQGTPYAPVAIGRFGSVIQSDQEPT